MSPTLLEALLLFVGLFATLSLIGCVDWLYRLARWWREERKIPRPVRITPVPVPVQLDGPLPVRVVAGRLSGELLVVEPWGRSGVLWDLEVDD